MWGLRSRDGQDRCDPTWPEPGREYLSCNCLSINQTEHPALVIISSLLDVDFIPNIKQKLRVKYKKLLRRFLLPPPTSRQLNIWGHGYLPPPTNPCPSHSLTTLTGLWGDCMHCIGWATSTMGFYYREQDDPATSWWMIKVWYCEYWHYTYWYCHPS